MKYFVINAFDSYKLHGSILDTVRKFSLLYLRQAGVALPFS